MSQTLQSVLCITTNKYLVHVLVVLLHARVSVVGPIPFLLAAIFFPVHPYIGSTTVLPDIVHHFSSESLGPVQCHLQQVHAFGRMHAVSQYLVKRAYTLHTFSACMPHLPPQQRGEPPCTFTQHPTRTAYTPLGPLTCH